MSLSCENACQDRTAFRFLCGLYADYSILYRLHSLSRAGGALNRNRVGPVLENDAVVSTAAMGVDLPDQVGSHRIQVVTGEDGRGQSETGYAT